ncbi:MAG: S-methyl-5'-thioinosine phosphorylase [Anaerolineales bacterium]|nr:S-methyl-5'-thioinosine phosphorylase [Anaerolineales bacterium]
MPYAIIGGTGFSRIVENQFKPELVRTPYGQAKIYLGQLDGAEFVFLPRHGVDHTIPPHKINYRANIRALKSLGVERIMATFAVGSLHRGIPPKAVVALDQFIDFTNGRESTFFDGGKSGLAHTEVNFPYCPGLQTAVVVAAKARGLEIMPKGTYVCTNGPRFETPAEVRMYAQLGGDVVGMTGVPEAPLARELEMHYGAVAYSINWGAGLEEKINVVADLEGIKQTVFESFVVALQTATTDDCECESALMMSHPPTQEEFNA